MPEPKRHIEEEMAETTEKTIQELPEEHYLVTNIGGLYIEVFVLIDKSKVVSSYAKTAVLAMAARNFRLLQCANHSIYDGFYDTSMILLRTVCENNLLMKYLTDNEQEAIAWLKGKRFKPSFLRRKVKDMTHIYGFLSNSHAHANVESLFSTNVSTFANKTLNLKYFPEFDIKQAKICFNTYIIFAWLSLIFLQYAFRDLLWKNEEWKNRIADWNKIVLDYIERK
jgi:hypothetical protein